jgi:hypothetical protein
MFKQGEGESVDTFLEETMRIKEVRENRHSEAEFMDFLNNMEGVYGFYQVFLLSPLQCTVTEL